MSASGIVCIDTNFQKLVFIPVDGICVEQMWYSSENRSEVEKWTKIRFIGASEPLPSYMEATMNFSELMGNLVPPSPPISSNIDHYRWFESH